jgi:hypothetical protein
MQKIYRLKISNEAGEAEIFFADSRHAEAFARAIEDSIPNVKVVRQKGDLLTSVEDVHDYLKKGLETMIEKDLQRMRNEN